MKRALRNTVAAGILSFGALTTSSDPCLASASVYSSKSVFVSVLGQRVAATFEDVTVPQFGPFTSGSVSFPTNAMQVTDTLVLPHSFFFGSEGSAPNFAVVSGPTWELRATFSVDVGGSGFDLNCFGCDTLPNSSVLEWSTYGPQGTLIESGTTHVDFSGTQTLRFFGLTSDKPFRSLHVRRVGVGVGSSLFSTWVIDDIRIVPGASVPVPVLGPAAVVVTAVLVGIAGAFARRRVRIES